MKNGIAILLICLMLCIYQGVMITKEHHHENDVRRLSNEVNQLSNQVKGHDREFRRLRENDSHIQGVTEDISLRLSEVEGRNAMEK